MSIFGEKYSKEKYLEAKEDEDVSFGRIKETAEIKKAGIGTPHSTNVDNILNQLFVNAGAAKRKMEKLYGKGQAEANKLNEEYDHLVAQAKEAVKAVESFEKEKLGMSSE